MNSQAPTDFRERPPVGAVPDAEFESLRAALGITRVWVLLLAGCGGVLLTAISGQAAVTLDWDSSFSLDSLLDPGLLALPGIGWTMATLLRYSRAISRFRTAPTLPQLRDVIAAQRAVWMALGINVILGFSLGLLAVVLNLR